MILLYFLGIFAVCVTAAFLVTVKRLKELAYKLNETKRQLNDASNKLTALEQQTGEKERRLNQKENEAEEYRKKWENTQEELWKKENDFTRQKQELEDKLKYELNEAERRFAEINGKLQEMQKSLERKEEEVEGLKDQLKQKENDFTRREQEFKDKLADKERENGILQQKVDDLEKSNAEMSEIKSSVGRIEHASNSIKDDIKNVLNSFVTSSGKGKLGEWALKDLLQSIRISGWPGYNEKPKLKGGTPDFAIPIGRHEKKYLYIDSKFPEKAYSKFLQNNDEKDFNNFIASLTAEVNNIKKKYVSVEDSVGVAVLYLPIEGMVSDLIANESGRKFLVNAANDGVVILSSFYLPYFFHLFVDCYSQVDWNNFLVSNAPQIRSLLKTINEGLSTFKDNFEKFGPLISNMGSAVLKLMKFFDPVSDENSKEQKLLVGKKYSRM